ncbi:MAG: hypothetical protein ACXWF2_12880 [Usitatibacter sp.]
MPRTLFRTQRFAVRVALALAVGGAAHAADFASPGAKAVLSVDYTYDSKGRKSSEGMYDPYEWRVTRTMSLVAELAAQPPTAMPTVQTIDGAQMAQLQGTQSKAQGVAMQMAPMAAEVQKILAKCGDNEACMTRETGKMAAAMQGTPQMAAAMGAKKDIQELSAPGAPRYQAWRATAQKGTYLIDELVHISVTDPICTSKPRHRCTREETRKGSGDVPVPQEATSKRNQGAAAGVSAVELDAAKNTLTVGLPIALAMLPYTELITTDEPEGTHDTPTPKGPQKRQAFYRVNPAGSTGFMHDKPFTVALKGGWRSQEGEYSVPLKGNFGDAGTLTVRWRFKVM